MQNILPIILIGSLFVTSRFRRIKRYQNYKSNLNSQIYQETGYKDGIPFEITILIVDGKPVEISTAKEYIEMKNATQKEKIYLKISEGFRTYKQQEYFYNCYINKNCNNGNKAAKPGFGNHQLGIALDLKLDPNKIEGPVYKWLLKNANKFQFYQTLKEEPWHWVYSITPLKMN